MKCWNCNAELILQSENPLEINAHQEHIIPMSLGGKLKSRKLICKNCNNAAGHSVDKVLEKQFLPISTMLDVKARSKKLYTAFVAETGEMRMMPPGMKGAIKLIIQGKDLEPVVTFVKDEKELQERIKSIQKQWEKNGWDYELSELEPEMPGPLKITNVGQAGHFFFGNRTFFEAMLKIAINFFIHNGGDADQIKPVIAAANGTGDRPINDFAKLYFPDLFRLPKDIVQDNDEVYHRLIIDGDPKTKILYCRIELFKFCKVLVVLSTNYSGVRIKESYAYDLIKETPIDIPIDDLTRQPSFYRDFHRLKMGANEPEFKRQLDNVLRILDKKQEEIRAKSE